MKRSTFFLSLFLIISCGRSSEESEQSAVIDSLKSEIAQLEQANDTLSAHLTKRAYVTRDYPSYFDTIANPEEFLLENLQENPSLIPKEAVLGGTMRFTGVSFINNELLIAEYEDGHVMGKAVFSYSIDLNGEIRFKMVGTVK